RFVIVVDATTFSKEKIRGVTTTWMARFALASKSERETSHPVRLSAHLANASANVHEADNRDEVRVEDKAARGVVHLHALLARGRQELRRQSARQAKQQACE